MNVETSSDWRSITVSRPVQIRAKVTEGLKKRLASELQEALRRIDLEVQQIDLQVKKASAEIEKGGPQQVQGLKQHLELERQKRVERKSALLEKLKEIARLETGSEVVQGTVEGFATVSVGDRWEDVAQASIVLEDGVVVEIRCR
ncbi:MAG: hypothetical protein HPY55_11300 [Firmicutes bacterium]|nr:hypothetical protein [Bacillota bacterium]